MNKVVKILGAAAIAASLSACQTLGDGPNQAGGTLIGAAGGALLASQIGGGSGKLAAVAIGALAGAAIGNSIGASMDQQDRQRTTHVLETTPSNQQVAWNNPDTGHHVIVPQAPTYQNDGQPCREFSHTVLIGGKREQAYGTACRQADGSWKIVQ